MAKKKAGRKSRAVREYLSENPQAGPKEVVGAMKKRRIRVSTQLVNNIKAKMGLTGGGKKTARKKATKKKGAARAAASRRDGEVSFEQLRDAKELADQLGGVEEAQKALKALEELQEG